jgi:hypothetical protein
MNALSSCTLKSSAPSDVTVDRLTSLTRYEHGENLDFSNSGSFMEWDRLSNTSGSESFSVLQWWG